jgi:CBS domain containing-hemolysin-like protein
MNKLIGSILIVVLGSGILSMIEAALFSVPINKAKILFEQKRKGAKSLIIIKENMHRFITVIVIFNNIFNIFGSMMIGLIAWEVLNSYWIGFFSAALTFLIIIFGEIIPKNIGGAYAVSVSLFVSSSLIIITKLFSPLIFLIDFLNKPFEKNKKLISEDEIKILSHLGHMEGSIEADEKEMIQKVFLLNDISAKDIMTPRTVVEALDGDATLEESKEKIFSLPHSRLPIYKDNLDCIIGVCHQRDLLIALGRDEKEKKIKEFKKENYLLFVSENMRVDELIPLFQKQKTHLAIVNDSFGGTSGVITLEDVLEQIVGEIVDETDKDIDLRLKAEKLNNNKN